MTPNQDLDQMLEESFASTRELIDFLALPPGFIAELDAITRKVEDQEEHKALPDGTPMEQ